MNRYHYNEEQEMANFLRNKTRNFKLIECLKFQNQFYRQGDDISLRQKAQGSKDCYAKVLAIAKIQQTQFPIVLASWYYTREDTILKDQELKYLGKKELVLSQYQDWQYIESVKGKIKVVSISDYEQMDWKDREADQIFFCRSAMNGDGEIQGELERRCHCLRVYNPDELIISCNLCGFRFHPHCVNNNEEICALCQ